MTKTLTEQWREGTLPAGHYYCKLYYNGFKPRIQECVKSAYSPKSCIPMSCGCEGEEVLEPVPSYDEFLVLSDFKKIEKDAIDNLVKIHTEKLEKKLEIATKALKEYADSSNWYETDDFGISAVDQFACDDYGYNIAQEAIKEMEGVK